MKNIKIYNQKNVLAVMAGILVTGLILNTVHEITLTKIVGIDNATFQEEFDKDIEYIETTPVEETVLEKAATISPEDTLKAQRIENIRKYLAKRNSPLAAYANEFVEAADYYNIDYRLVAAISIIESSGGLYNFKPYNAWGWGSYSFKNFKEGIWTVSKGLGGYYSRGLDTPKEISVYYCPPSASSWASKVTYVMNQIGK